MNNKQDFKNSIKIRVDKEKERIKRLQYEYQQGIINENEISKEDYQKLLELYDEQNKEIEEEIERDRKEIEKMLKELKKNGNA